jgi:hypothetical protein
MPTYVNLDALVPREDFAVEAPENAPSDMFEKLGIDRLLSGSGSEITTHLRKPDFQRETNHWTPQQICTLLQSFTENDLIPALILWNSKTHIFVIDGCHRISVLRAWIEDDYGDGAISVAHFGIELPKEQIRAAKRTRELVNGAVGSFKYLQQINTASGNFAPDLVLRAKTAKTRTVQIQWIYGNAEKAETSFFKINTQGTALDDVEERLLRNRKKPAAIAARAVVRAGRGHRYWSQFDSSVGEQIEKSAQAIYEALFEPEVTVPLKTLNIPIGGPYSSHNALDLLMAVIEVVQGAFGESNTIENSADDPDGAATVRVLQHCLRTANRIVGNDSGSLGLDPAVYFYTQTGRFNRDIFLAFVALFAKAERNNNTSFFFRFTEVREELEGFFVQQKPLLTQINIATSSKHRRSKWVLVVEALIERLKNGDKATPEFVLDKAGFTGDTLAHKKVSASISDDIKSAAYILKALENPMLCPVCRGILSPKSLSYDHKQPKSVGGTGALENVQITHPFCNSAVKNQSDNPKP